MTKHNHKSDTPRTSEAAVACDDTPPVLTEEHIEAISHLGAAYSLLSANARPAWLPRNEKAFMAFCATYVSSARAFRLEYPAVFNSSDFRFSFHVLEALFQRVQEAVAAIAIMRDILAALVAYKNILVGNREHGAIPLPRSETGMLPTVAPLHSGLAALIIGQVALLRQQAGVNEAVLKQFGVVAPAQSHPDLATVNPNATASFNGGSVTLAFRSPAGIRGVEFAEIRCDRGDGHAHLVATTRHARFTDFHDLPPAGARATWVFHVCYVDRNGNFVGQESVVDVVVQGRSHQM